MSPRARAGAAARTGTKAGRRSLAAAAAGNVPDDAAPRGDLRPRRPPGPLPAGRRAALAWALLTALAACASRTPQAGTSAAAAPPAGATTRSEAAPAGETSATVTAADARLDAAAWASAAAESLRNACVAASTEPLLRSLSDPARASAIVSACTDLQQTYGPIASAQVTTARAVGRTTVASLRLATGAAGTGVRLDAWLRSDRRGALDDVRLETWRPPAGLDLTALREDDVVVGRDPWPLPGTVTAPSPAPSGAVGVVLVHGSGPNDRDETVGAHKVLRDLAWGLAQRGVVVLRYDKRTKVYGAAVTAPDAPGLTVREETIDDAVAAARLLAAHPEVDPRRVVVIGHSLGAYLAPRIGAQLPELAGLVSLAGPVTPLHELIAVQVPYVIAADGEETAEEQAMAAAIAAELPALRRAFAGEPLPPTEIVLGAPGTYWNDLAGYDPAALARTQRIALLVIQGGRDYQVPATELERWRKGLRGRKGATLRSYPALDHLLTAGSGPSVPADYERPGHVDEQLLDELAQWLLALPPAPVAIAP